MSMPSPNAVECISESTDWQKQDDPGTEFVINTFGCSCCSEQVSVDREFGIRCLDAVIARLEKQLARYREMRLRYPL